MQEYNTRIRCPRVARSNSTANASDFIPTGEKMRGHRVRTVICASPCVSGGIPGDLPNRRLSDIWIRGVHSSACLLETIMSAIVSWGRSCAVQVDLSRTAQLLDSPLFRRTSGRTVHVTVGTSTASLINRSRPLRR